jgi:hypothetical protein
MSEKLVHALCIRSIGIATAVNLVQSQIPGTVVNLHVLQNYIAKARLGVHQVPTLTSKLQFCKQKGHFYNGIAARQVRIITTHSSLPSRSIKIDPRYAGMKLPSFINGGLIVG